MAATEITEVGHQVDDRPRNDRGASLVEYALLVALIAIVCIGAMSFFGTSMSDRYDRSTSSMFVDD